MTPDETPPVFLELDSLKRPLGAFAAQLDADGNALAAAALADGRLAVVRRGVEKNEMTGEATESLGRAELDAPGRITALVIDPAQKNLYAGTAAGDLLWWTLQDGQPGDLHSANAGAPITALSLLLGGRSLAVGQENGALSVWFPVNESGDTVRLARMHEFPRHPDAIRRIAPSQRDRSFLAASARAARSLLLDRRPHPVDRRSAGARRRGPLLHPEGGRRLRRRWRGGGGARHPQPASRDHGTVAVRQDLVRRVCRARLGLAVERRLGRLRAQAVAHPAAGGHAQGDVLLAAAGDSPRRLRRHVHLAVHASGVQAVRQADGRDHGLAAQRGARLSRRPLAGAADRAGGAGPGADGDRPAALHPARRLPLEPPAARVPRPLPGRHRGAALRLRAGRRRRPLPALVGRFRALRLRRRLQDLAVQRHGARLRSAQRRGGGAGHGLRGDPDHLRDRRGRLLERAGEPGGRLARPRAPTAGRR